MTLEERLAEYMRSDAVQVDISEITTDYQRQGLPVPPAEQIRDEAVSEARKCLETIMICEERGHLWTEKADPENGRSELTCRRCGAVDNLQW